MSSRLPRPRSRTSPGVPSLRKLYQKEACLIKHLKALESLETDHMKNIEEIKKKLEELKPFLKEKFKLKSIGIFGSYIRGEEKKGSDLDILVEFEESAGLSLLEFIRLENYLSEELGVKVDLVEKSTLKPRIGKSILEEVINL
ncbi:MAG: nucleotidyltransferase family protein [Nitrososphaerota archaeon]